VLLRATLRSLARAPGSALAAAVLPARRAARTWAADILRAE
jgi:ABC-type lipoprotein release transport system permease subunit